MGGFCTKAYLSPEALSLICDKKASILPSIKIFSMWIIVEQTVFPSNVWILVNHKHLEIIKRQNKLLIFCNTVIFMLVIICFGYVICEVSY